MATALQAASVSQPSTFPWGGRRDLHPLARGSRPRASTTSASTTVRLEGIAPSPLAYQASARAVVLQAGSHRKVAMSKGRIRSSGCHTTRRPEISEETQAKQATSESNAAPRIWTPESSQMAAHAKRSSSSVGVSGRIRTSASDLRSVVSRSAGRIHGPSDWNRTSDNVVVGDVLCS